jgi:hypothetical protein
MPNDSQWVKDVRAYMVADKNNKAKAAFTGFPDAQNAAGNISDLYSGLGFRAEDLATDFTDRSNAARQAMVGQFDQRDAQTQAGFANSENYLSELANRLGLSQALQGPGVESANQQKNQVLALNNTNRTNQLASYDLLRGTYGDLLKDRAANADNMATQSLSQLLSTLLAQQGAMGGGGSGGSGGGGGGGGRGRSGRSSGGSSSGGTDFPAEQMNFMAINPYNPPSGSSYSSDYVRADMPRNPKPVPVTAAKKRITQTQAINARKGGAKRPVTARK